MTGGGAELRTNKPDVVEKYNVGGRPIAVISKRRAQRGALSAITTQKTILARQHPVEDETNVEVIFKTLPRAKAAVAKPSSRRIAIRDGIAMAVDELQIELRV